MGAIFNGVATENIEAFFGGMMMCDCSLPHTKTRLSPITFSEFLNRNQICALNQEDIYKEANRFWAKYNSYRPELLAGCQGPAYEIMQSCEEPRHTWNPLIDYLLRIQDITKFGQRTFYQMHYLAHVCYLFFTSNVGETEEERTGYKQIFNLMISPMIYKPFIPTQYNWMPVIMYTDIRFNECLEQMVSQIDQFIKSHSSRYMSYPRFDKGHLDVLFSSVNNCLQEINKSRYRGMEVWSKHLEHCFTQASTIATDVRCCEMYSAFERDGMQICKAINAIEKSRRAFRHGEFEDDPESAIDSLLDVYSILKQGLAKYEPERKRESVDSKESYE